MSKRERSQDVSLMKQARIQSIKNIKLKISVHPRLIPTDVFIGVSLSYF
jgi:hypothetical protein